MTWGRQVGGVKGTKMEASHRFRNHASRPRAAGFTHIGDIIEIFLDELLSEVEENVDAGGGFRGPVRPLQRPWSWTIDAIEFERQEGAI